MIHKFCDGNCNECKLLRDKNSRILTRIFNEAYQIFGKDFYQIVQKNCPNMTVCYDCRTDDFCHSDNCKITKDIYGED